MRSATGEPEPPVKQIRELEERLDKFRISVDSDITIRGSAWQGYAVNIPFCPELPAPIGPCPCIRVTFSGLSFCGCQDLATGSVNYSDVNLNGNTFDMYRPSPGDEGLCSGCSFQIPFLAPLPTVHLLQYDANSCGGSLVVDTDRTAFIFVMRIGSRWGIIVADTGAATWRIIFYAETTSISGPIANQLNCNAYPYVPDSTAFLDCFIPNLGSSPPWIGVTTGGTVTITEQTDDCGACCQDGTGSDCNEGTAAHCVDDGGTFHSGEHCIVDPDDGTLTCP